MKRTLTRRYYSSIVNSDRLNSYDEALKSAEKFLRESIWNSKNEIVIVEVIRIVRLVECVQDNKDEVEVIEIRK